MKYRRRHIRRRHCPVIGQILNARFELEQGLDIRITKEQHYRLVPSDDGPTLTRPAMATDLGQPHILARFSQRTRAEEGNDVPPGVRMSALTVNPRPQRPLSPVQQEPETRALVFLDADLVRARVSRGRIMRGCLRPKYPLAHTEYPMVHHGGSTVRP